MKLFEHLATAIIAAGATACIMLVVMPPRTPSVQVVATGPAPPKPNKTIASTPASDFNHAAILKLEDDGHFWARAEVDGTSVKLMVDTGASIVALTFRDAQRIGLKPEDLEYNEPINTAGGRVFGAYVKLEEIAIGNVELEGVDAMVLRDGLDQSLLGMSFLKELYSYEFKNGSKRLILRK